MKYAVIFFLFFLVCPALAADPILPDARLTPGVVMTVDVNQICVPGYSKSVRHTSQALKSDIYRAYGIRYHKGGYEIDHLIPLSLGGADVKENLWPQSNATWPWNAEVKDRLEWKLHRMVCRREIALDAAQQAFAANWIESYKRFCPNMHSCRSYERRADLHVQHVVSAAD